MENKNSKLLKDFVKYCSQHPNLRFWQAMYGWTGSIIKINDEDSYYFEGKDK